MHLYTDALLKEICHTAPIASGYTVDTVFFGGGTPSLLPSEELFRIMSCLQRHFTIESDAEITLEANPATVDASALRGLRSLGFNRISIGVQSLQDDELKALGRLHTAADAIRISEDAREAGFANINLDLMYGIPYQTPSSFSKTIDGVLALSPEHISAYSLIVEEGTPFYQMRDTLPLPSEDAEETLHNLLLTRLSENGYLHYEISNYAKAGYESRHNLHYWRSEPYLGFGAAAHSFFNGVRYGNTAALTLYEQAPLHAVSEKQRLTEKEQAYERLMLGLRLSEGIDLAAYKTRFGVSLKEKHEALITRFENMGLLRIGQGRIRLTEKGMRLSNSILVAFLEEDS